MIMPNWFNRTLWVKHCFRAWLPLLSFQVFKILWLGYWIL